MKNSHFARTAFIIGALAFVAAGVAQAQDAKPFLGAWKGAISIAGTELEIGINFALDESKAVKGTFDSPSQGAMGLELAGIKIEGKTVLFIIANVPGDPAFKGTLDETGKKLSGDFTQSGYAGTFAVEKQ